MPEVLVVGGGPAGIATAARLAKLGHAVRLVEAGDHLGGRLRGATVTLPAGEFTFDDGPATMLLPAALRDLFRKSGRPLESACELELVTTEHRFPDGSRVHLPGGSRAAQLRAVDELGAGLGAEWCTFVHAGADDWDHLRRGLYERSYAAGVSRELDRLVSGGASMADRVAALSDQRLRSLATVEARLDGHLPDRVPEWLALLNYLEQRLGRWRIRGGGPRLVAALEQRLEQRRVRVETGVARDYPDGALAEALVVWAAPPTGPLDSGSSMGVTPGWRARLEFRRTAGLGGGRADQPVSSAHARGVRRVHLALTEEWDGPARTVLHTADPVELTAGPSAPGGHAALTLTSRSDRDPVALAEEFGITLRDRVLERRDSVGRTAPEETWLAPRTDTRLLGPKTHLPRVWRASPAMAPGLGLTSAWLAAAQTAHAIGRG